MFLPLKDPLEPQGGTLSTNQPASTQHGDLHQTSSTETPDHDNTENMITAQPKPSEQITDLDAQDTQPQLDISDLSSDGEQQQHVQLRRSHRPKKKNKEYDDHVLYQATSTVNEPQTYKEAMEGPEKDQCETPWSSTTYPLYKTIPGHSKAHYLSTMS